MTEPRLADLLDRLAGGAAPVDVEAIAAGAKRRQRRQRALAVIAVVVVLIAGATVTAAVTGRDTGDVRTAHRPATIGLSGDRAVWPGTDRPGDPGTLALRFASEVLDWPGARIGPTLEGNASPTLVTISRADGRATVRALAAPVVAGQWAFVEIGDGLVLQRLDAGRSRLEMRAVAGARALDWWARLTDGRELSGTSASARRAEVPADASRIASAVVVARDASGLAIGAAGGAYGSTPPDLGAVVVPDLLGSSVREARSLLAAARLSLSVDRGIDSDDPAATVVAQEPGDGVRIAVGSVIGVRTAAPRPDATNECPASKVAPDAPPDALPAAGQTDLDVVRQLVDSERGPIISTFRGIRVLLAHRGGNVYRQDGTASPPVEHRDDYQIIVELPSPAACPPTPQVWNGVPLAFVWAGPEVPVGQAG
jgi:hypothetical protein